MNQQFDEDSDAADFSDVHNAHIERLKQRNRELLALCCKANTLFQDMSRFVGKMALQDYGLFNDVSIGLENVAAHAERQLDWVEGHGKGSI